MGVFIANGAEFLEKYGQVKVYRLISKFMARVVEQIDRYRKDRTLGRIRRVAASVAPRTNPKGAAAREDGRGELPEAGEVPAPAGDDREPVR